MNDKAASLGASLIRNFNDAPLERLLREPHYDTQCARLAKGTAARKLGASVDVLAPGKRSCPYHLHHAQEEMFIIVEGSGTLRVAGEMLASGSRHADNLAPCIFGGFTLVRSTEPLDIIPMDFPALFATIIHPQIEIKTSEARALLPKQVPLSEAIRNWSNLGSLVAALAKGDYSLISRSMEDTIVEPIRKSLIPKFDEVKSASLAAGALGGGISGSGPSIFMLSETEEVAEKVESAMRYAYNPTGIPYNTYVSRIHPDGVRFV